MSFPSQTREYRKNLSGKHLIQVKAWQKTPRGVIRTIYNTQVQTAPSREMDPPDYTLEEFEAVFLNDEFMSLYKTWEESGYKTRLKPSLDRKDAHLPYMLSNLQLMTAGENAKKGAGEKRLKYAKPIDVYNPAGDLVGSYESSTDAAKALGVYPSRITTAVQQNRELPGGLRVVSLGANTPRFKNAEAVVRKIVIESLERFGYFCYKIAFNSGLVINQDGDPQFPSLSGYDPTIRTKAFTKWVGRVVEDEGLMSTIMKTKGCHSKIFYRDIKAMSDQIRTIPELEIALIEYLKDQPEG